MKTSCILIIFLCVLSPLREVSAEVQPDDIEPRIVGGVLATIDEYPCVCSLRFKGKHFCTGTYLGGTKVLTAAHCVTFDGFDPQLVTVHFGTSFLDEVGIKRFIESFTVAPGYNKKTLADDCAVIRVRQPVASVAACSLSTAQLSKGDPVKVVGWGKTKLDNTKPSNQLRKVTVKMLSKADCVAKYQGRAVLRTSMICAAAPGKDACSGDSGGPMFIPGTNPLLIHGITSWGIGCAQAGSPGVYTSIRRMTNFINNN